MKTVPKMETLNSRAMFGFGLWALITLVALLIKGYFGLIFFVFFIAPFSVVINMWGFYFSYFLIENISLKRLPFSQAVATALADSLAKFRL